MWVQFENHNSIHQSQSKSKSQCLVGEEGKKVLDRMLIPWPRFPVNIERSLIENF